MDLGATICATRAPHCLLCPVRDVCAAARAGTQERYPVKSRRLVRGRRDNVWLELRWRDAVWLVERAAERRLGRPLEPARARFDRRARGDDARVGPAAARCSTPFVHVLTHFDWHLQPVRWTFPARDLGAALAPLLARWPRGRWFDARCGARARPAGAAQEAAAGEATAGA